MKTVSITIRGGTTTMDFHGFPGRECEKAEKAILAIAAALGVEQEPDDRFVKEEREKEAEDVRQLA